MNKEKVKKESNTNFLSLQQLEINSDKSVSDKSFAQWVRALTQNWRQGTVGVKGRSDVSLTNKKPFKQKGTGRARAGSARSPLWRGGGVIFGPQKRTKILKLNKNTKKNVLGQLVRDYSAAEKIMVLDWTLPEEGPKTKSAFASLKKLNVEHSKVLLLLPEQDYLAYASFNNLPNVHIALFDQLNAYDLACADYWLVLKKDVDAFKQMVAQWN